jgi:hypothetical protein
MFFFFFYFLKMNSNLLIVQSSKRNYGSNIDFTIPAYLDQASAFSIKSIQMINNIYNITQNNNKVYFYDGTADCVAIIAEGNYSATQLATLITAEMNAVVVSPTFVALVTYDSQTNKFTFTDSSSTGPWQLQWNKAVLQNQSLYNNLGFAGVLYSGVISYTSPFQINLTAVQYVDVLSKVLTQMSNNQGCDNQLLERIPVGAYQYGATVYYEPKYRIVRELQPHMLVGNIDIRLVDNFSRPVALDPNVDIILVIEWFK